MSGIIGDSILLTHRLPIAYATIGAIVLLMASLVIRRMHRRIEQERRARRREESLR